MAESKGHLVRRDLEQVYQGIFLQAVVSFERATEELFVRMLSKKIIHPDPVLPYVTMPNMKIAMDILLQGKKYIDWLPIEHTERMASLFFRDAGNPFVCITPAHRVELQKVMVIRNVIAHHSQHSLKQFDRHIAPRSSLPRRQRDILGYLQSSHTGHTNKFEYHLGELNKSFRDLCT